MARLVVNPGSPAAWEIQLKPGANYIGRGFANDFKIPDPSVSGSHCQITVTNGLIVLKDLGSTNGTFVNRAPVKEVPLQPGQVIHLGAVEMAFYSDGPAPVVPAKAAPTVVAVPAVAAVPAAAVTPGDAPVIIKPAARPLTLSPAIARTPAPAVAVAAPPPTVPFESPPLPPPLPTPNIPGSKNCKFHPKTPGRYYCSQCHHFFCELCVTAREVGGGQKKMCRHCGIECAPVQVQLARPAAPKSFFNLLPGGFAYPFKGNGLLLLIVSTIVLSLLNMFRGIAMGGLFSWGLALIALGYLFSFMQNIIHATANQEEEMPDLPGFDDVLGGAFRMIVTVLFCFAAPVALGVAKVFEWADIPTSAIIGTVVLGCLYFPMAFLAVAMKDSVLAANPLVVFPAIFKAPLGYLVTALILEAGYGMQKIGDFLMLLVQQQSYRTRSMAILFLTFAIRAFWSFAGVYLLTVSMRILGLLYVTNKHKFGWFDR